MKKSAIFRDTHLLISRLSLSVIIAAFLLHQGCKKDTTDNNSSSVPSPIAMQVISGNNQMGYPGKPLEDTIVIKITPKNTTDIDSYSYFFRNSTGGSPITSVSVSNGEFYIRVVWVLGQATSPQQVTVVLYGCANPFNNACKPLDSVVLKATVNDRPWVRVFADNSGSVGPGALWDIHFSDASHGVAVGDFKTGLLITDNGGASWNFISSIRDDYYKLAFSNKDTGLAIVTNNYAYFTVDGGNTFTGGSWSPPIIGHLASADIFMQNRNVIYTVGNQGTVTKSINGGQSWTKYNGFSFINRLNSITCTDPNTCYACGDVAKIIKTSDGGNLWIEQPILINNHLKKIYFLNNVFGFAAGQLGALVRTTDGGSHWTVIPTGLRFDIIEIRFFSNTDGFIVSTAGEIAKTTDGGLNWKKVVADNYGVYDLNKAFVKDATTVFGLQWQNIFKYDLR